MDLFATRHGRSATGRGVRDRHLQSSTSYGTTSPAPLGSRYSTRTWSARSSSFQTSTAVDGPPSTLAFAGACLQAGQAASARGSRAGGSRCLRVSRRPNRGRSRTSGLLGERSYRRVGRPGLQIAQDSTSGHHWRIVSAMQTWRCPPWAVGDRRQGAVAERRGRRLYSTTAEAAAICRTDRRSSPHAPRRPRPRPAPGACDAQRRGSLRQSAARSMP